ncbi:MAG: transcription elongation factor GreB [Myxococcota bacterium]
MPSYISPEGHKRIVDEYNWLLHKERPRITAEVSYAASLGDRSENSEYLYGKKRLREIDKRLHFLEKRLAAIEVVDPSKFSGETVLFGATVEIEDEEGETQTWTILGEDEVDTEKRRISYVAPLGRALIGKKTGDFVTFDTPKGRREVTIVSVSFPRG